jgi:hypothetical protein
MQEISNRAINTIIYSEVIYIKIEDIYTNRRKEPIDST